MSAILYILERLQVLQQGTESSESMRLFKLYYTISFREFKSMSEYLTQIKVLEELIGAGNFDSWFESQSMGDACGRRGIHGGRSKKQKAEQCITQGRM